MRLERLAYACFASLALKTDAGRRAPRPSLLATGGLGDAREGSAPFLTSPRSMPISRNVHCAKPFPRAELAHYRSGGVIYHSERCGMDEQGPRDAQHWTLYGALRRLLDQGWIERFTEDESPRD